MLVNNTSKKIDHNFYLPATRQVLVESQLFAEVKSSMAIIKRLRGTVTEFSFTDGTGIIVTADGREAVVRYSAIRGKGVRKLVKGMVVSFLLEETRRGLYAVCVQPE
jgi:cold shock CspA family protein